MSSAGHHLHHGAEHTGEQHSKGDHPWAKYVGVHSDEAVKAIKEENPSLNVHVVPKVRIKLFETLFLSHFCAIGFYGDNGFPPRSSPCFC